VICASVGKTTTCSRHADQYLNWDIVDDRAHILGGHARLAERLKLDRLGSRPPVVLFDELHKHAKWKHFLKGFFDAHVGRVRTIVTGSSRMDVYRRGGDSLMGRYFVYRMHPFSVAECVAQTLPDARRVTRKPSRIKGTEFNALWEFGGYPEPFLKRDPRFTRRWQSLRQEQLVREDVRDLTQIHQLDQLEAMVRLLGQRSSQQLIYSNVGSDVRVTTDTARRWVETLCSLHLGFLVRPWHKSVARSLRKEPKWFLRDWSGVDDPGARAETFVACHLLKAVEGWTDLGLGKFELGYLRDKQQHEVDFVVARDGKPWFLVEVKSSDTAVSPSLKYFQQQIRAPFAFQVVIDANYVDADCFQKPGDPLVVPARTFLSQLV
jgi:predicted AAA+ superfamily ATPase